MRGQGQARGDCTPGVIQHRPGNVSREMDPAKSEPLRAAPKADLSDADLWAQLCAGDSAGLAGLYARHGGLVYAICFRVLGEQGPAEDATQDVFLNLWSRRRGWDPDLGRFTAWLATAARNRAIDLARRRRARAGRETAQEVDGLPGSAIADPWDALTREMERDAVIEAVRQLPGAQQEVIELAYWSGYTHRDISSMLDLPLGTVKGRMRLALEKLQSFLDARGVGR